MNYTVLHCHCDMSNGITNIDSVTKYQDYIKLASELGMTAFAISDHGCVFDWYGKKEAIEKAGMKYIHAEEFYVTEKIEIGEDGKPIKIRDNWHCLLISRNFEGFKELNRLSSKSFNREDGHFYYSPRITFDELLNTSDNIIILSACLGGILNHASDDIQKKFLDFMAQHKDRCFLEVQHHGVNVQRIYNQRLYDLSRQYDIDLVACTDTHSLNEEHARGRKILQISKDIRFEDEDGWDMTFKSYEELCNAFEKQGALPKEVYLKAIENTNRIADMVEPFEVDHSIKYPHIYENSLQTFKKKINEGYKNNPYIHHRHPKEVIFQRLREELEVYEKVGAVDFMLLQSYIREWEKSNGVQSGYGRGSVSGSLIAYLLDVTKMDSLKFNLNFFRFLNPNRVTNSDVDTDYSEKDREKLKYFLLHDKLNLPNIKTSEIITFNTIAMKGAIKDVCRALNISLAEAQTISDAVSLNENHQWTISDEWKQKYPEVFEYVDIVNGTIVSIGTHPSGVLVTDTDIESDLGLCSIATSDYPVSMVDMHSLDAMMYVKEDVLGLDNIGVINETCKLLGIDRLTPDNTDLDDEAVWNSIREDTTLIFQWESDSAQAYLKKFMSDETIEKAKEKDPNFSYIKWFSFGNGLIRPSCASFRDDVSNGVFYDNGFKELNEFLAPEAGRVAMQETIMMFLVKFCGYSQAESDNVRRAIAKKKGTATLLPEIEQRFIDYSSTHYDITKEKCREVIKPFLQIILDASAYGFSWNHSDAYSCTGYICGFLRYYYPLEFLTAAFNTFADKEEKIVAITKYSDKIGIKILPPKFRHSRDGYQMEKSSNSIYKGVSSIKFLNSMVAETLYAMKDMQFDSFIDFLKVNPCDARQTDVLIRLGYFSEFGKTQKLLRIVELFNEYNIKKEGSSKTIKKEKCKLSTDLLSKYCEKETDKQYKFNADGIKGLLMELISTIPDRDIPLQTRLEAENEYLGYIQTRLPEEQDTAAIMDIDTKYSPKLTLYDLATGNVKKVKISKKTFENNPIVKGQIIKYRSEYRPKSYKNENGEWIKDESIMEEWLVFYGVTTKFC